MRSNSDNQSAMDQTNAKPSKTMMDEKDKAVNTLKQILHISDNYTKLLKMKLDDIFSKNSKQNNTRLGK